MSLPEPAPNNACGSCNLCCKLPAVPHIPGFGAKPRDQMCYLCDEGKGCTIYATRPPVCRDFECMWLITQKWGDGSKAYAPELRPDQCGVVVAGTTRPDIACAFVEPSNPDAWRRDDVQQMLAQITLAIGRVSITTPDPNLNRMMERVGPSTVAMRKIRMTDPDENGIQWAVGD